MVSDWALKQFIELYHQEFGVELSDAKATELATNLLGAFSYIYKAAKEIWLEPPPDS